MNLDHFASLRSPVTWVCRHPHPSWCLHPFCQPQPGKGEQDLRCSSAEAADAGKQMENITWSCMSSAVLAAMLHAVQGVIQRAPSPKSLGEKRHIKNTGPKPPLDRNWRDQPCFPEKSGKGDNLIKEHKTGSGLKTTERDFLSHFSHEQEEGTFS